MSKSIRIKMWEEFKRLAFENKPKSIVYVIAQGIPASNLTGLKLIMPCEGKQYILTDSAKDNRLRKTGLLLQTDEMGNRFIRDEDVKDFLIAQFGRKDLQILSYWTI